jgi:hypothetical protein
VRATNAICRRLFRRLAPTQQLREPRLPKEDHRHTTILPTSTNVWQLECLASHPYNRAIHPKTLHQSVILFCIKPFQEKIK